MLANCSYDPAELAVLNMARRGLLGELLHAEGGYMHELRRNLFSETPQIYRLRHSIKRNENLYPTHGLDPAARCLGVHHGDRFDRIVSMSTKSVCMNEYAAEKFGPDSPQARRDYACGDVNMSIIHTAKGCTILVGFSTHTPRSYSRMFMVQGSKGIMRKYPEEKIHIEGKSPGHSWEDFKKYREDYDHPIWTSLQERARGSGHGGIDFIENYRLIESLRRGVYPDMDVYDAAAVSAVGPLSGKSVAGGGGLVKFPDFTRGGWKNDGPPGGRLGAKDVATGKV